MKEQFEAALAVQKDYTVGSDEAGKTVTGHSCRKLAAIEKKQTRYNILRIFKKKM